MCVYGAIIFIQKEIQPLMRACTRIIIITMSTTLFKAPAYRCVDSSSPVGVKKENIASAGFVGKPVYEHHEMSEKSHVGYITRMWTVDDIVWIEFEVFDDHPLVQKMKNTAVQHYISMRYTNQPTRNGGNFNVVIEASITETPHREGSGVDTLIVPCAQHSQPLGAVETCGGERENIKENPQLDLTSTPALSSSSSMSEAQSQTQTSEPAKSVDVPMKEAQSAPVNDEVEQLKKQLAAYEQEWTPEKKSQFENLMKEKEEREAREEKERVEKAAKEEEERISKQVETITSTYDIKGDTLPDSIMKLIADNKTEELNQILSILPKKAQSSTQPQSRAQEIQQAVANLKTSAHAQPGTSKKRARESDDGATATKQTAQILHYSYLPTDGNANDFAAVQAGKIHRITGQ